MKAVIILALCATLALAATESHHHAKAGLADGRARMMAYTFATHAPVVVQGVAGVTDECFAAAQTLGQSFNSCPALTHDAGELFNNKTKVIDQAAVANYCEAPCKATFETDLQSFVTKCKPLEILLIENAAGSTFDLFKLIFALKMPCIKNGNEYCLPTFVKLTRKFDGNKDYQPTDQDLTDICTPCLKTFLVFLAKWMKPAELKGLFFVDLFCTKDGTTWCLPEHQIIDSMPETNKDEKIAKNTRICNTQCTQKIVIKIALAYKLIDTTPAEQTAIAAWYKALDIVCSRTKNGDTCGVLGAKVDARLDQAAATGCNLITKQCPDACRNNVVDFVNEYDCCFERFKEVELAWGGNGDFWGSRIDFAEKTCNIPIPAACTGANKQLVAKLVIRNLKFAAWYAAEKSKQAAILAAIAADIARELGAKESDSEADGASATVQAVIGHNGIVTYAEDTSSMTVTVTVQGASDAQINSFQTDLNNQVSTGSTAFNTLSGKADVSTRSDVTDGFSIDSSKSSTTQTAAGSNGAGQVAVSGVLVAGLVLAAAALQF